MNASPDISTAFFHAGLYRTLAQAFSYPDQQLLASLIKSWQTQLQHRESGWPEGVRELLLTALADLQDTSLPELAGAHVRLFGPSARCPLTETAWGDAARLLGKPVQIADISGFYRAFGLQPAAGPESVPEDHLVSELEFMSILYLKEAWAQDHGLHEQLAVTRDARNLFLEDHLATWIDYWTAQLLEENPPALYRTVATLLQTIIRSECERSGLRPQTIRIRARDTEVGKDTLECPLAGAP